MNEDRDVISVGGREISKDKLPNVITKSVAQVSYLAETVQQQLSAAQTACNRARRGENGVRNFSLVEDRHIWSLGFRVVDDAKSIEKLRDALMEVAGGLSDVANVQLDTEKIISDILRYQKQLADEMQFLYAVGALSLHACEMVAKQIKMRFEHAEDDEIDEAERMCLQRVLDDMRQKEETFKKYGVLNKDVGENKKRLDEKDKKDLEHDEHLRVKDEKDVEHDRRLDLKDEKDKEHDQRLKEKDLKDSEHDRRLNELEARLDELEGRFRQIDEQMGTRPLPKWLICMVVVNLILSVVALVILFA